MIVNELSLVVASKIARFDPKTPLRDECAMSRTDAPTSEQMRTSTNHHRTKFVDLLH